jgi:hypothetical protein
VCVRRWCIGRGMRCFSFLLLVTVFCIVGKGNIGLICDLFVSDLQFGVVGNCLQSSFFIFWF